MRSCIAAYDVSYLIVKSDELREMIETRLELRPVREVNQYAFYPTAGRPWPIGAAPPPCPLELDPPS
jgi:hypothetical protein